MTVEILLCTDGYPRDFKQISKLTLRYNDEINKCTKLRSEKAINTFSQPLAFSSKFDYYLVFIMCTKI